NEVFRWDPVEDKFIYTGKSYVLEGIRARWGMSKEDVTREIRDRAEILEWMNENEVRTYKEVAKAISRYTENPEDFLKKMRNPDLQKKKDDKKEEEPSKKKSKLSTKKEKSEKELNEMLTAPGEDQNWGQDESEIISENKIVALSDIEHIDVKTAALLQDNGIDSIEDLKNASVKDLSKIEGIDKKLAKKIKKEVEKNIKEKPTELEKNEKEEPEPETYTSHKIKPFEGIESIDDETAVLLCDTGFNSVDDLNNVSVKGLTKIKGFNKKTAKKTIKELEDIASEESSQDSDEGGERDAAE
ncbi:MAG: helix-hairpin-helix domain-containing protein, partial [Thermoplasmatales archaeon]|nr:helix-hairpin-helix domain-containing protein [Thermoplasmatales archaeon]